MSDNSTASAAQSQLDVLKQIAQDTSLPKNPSITTVFQPSPATTTKEQPTFEKGQPHFAPVKHPVRFAINGKQHLIQPLKDSISTDPNIPDEYKLLLHSEIDKRTTNAAQVDLHVVDHANGDTSVHFHFKGIQLG